MCQDELPPGLPGIKRKQPQKLTVSKIIQKLKVSFNIASEASYVYILNGQKFIRNAKMESIQMRIFLDFQTLCKSVIALVVLHTVC